jgi:hypothetical protein
MRSTLIGMVAVLLTAWTTMAAGQKSATRVRIFVETPVAEQGFVDRALQDRMDSTKDLAKALKGKDRWIELVADAAQADLTVSVTGRQMMPTGATRKASTPLAGAINGDEQKETAPEVTVLVRTRAGFETTIRGMSTAVFRLV